jgi:hypothetical protein
MTTRGSFGFPEHLLRYVSKLTDVLEIVFMFVNETRLRRASWQIYVLRTVWVPPEER